MQRLALFVLSFTAVLLAAQLQSRAGETVSLMATIAEWRYPDAALNGATMSDGETVDSQGVRTRPSIKCKAVLTTPDPMKKVVEYYKAKLSRAADRAPTDQKPQPASGGRSVTFHDDSQGRPLALQIIVVNTEKTTTTLVISRGEKESKTHIAWTHYMRL